MGVGKPRGGFVSALQAFDSFGKSSFSSFVHSSL